MKGWPIPAGVGGCLDTLRRTGHAAYPVGGCVRDLLLGRTPGDFDVCTDARPERVMELFPHTVPTGLRHGTVTVRTEDGPVEVTTFRREGRYTDHRRPDRVEFTGDLGEDLARRDFTINAMAWEPSGLTDPFGGRADLAAGVIRCVGEPERRFGEDALRLLRALRFAAQLDFRLEEGTAAGVRACAPQLACVSRERVAEELKRLVCGPAAGRVLLDCPEVLTGQVLPELAPAVGFDQRNPHHSYDVYTHCVRALERVPAEPGLRLAALLHDVGKPGCCTVDREGVGHFYGHAAAGAELADACLRRLRLDNALRERVVTLIRRHDLQLEPEPRLVKRWLGRLGPELFFQWTALAKADAGAKFPDRAPGAARWEQVEALARQILAERPCLTLRDLEADGNDALARGLRGPAVGRALAALLEEVMEGRLPNHRAELMAELDRLAGRER